MLILVLPVFCGAVWAYLAMRGIPPERIRAIFKHGLGGGLTISVLVAVANPATLANPTMFAICLMGSLVFVTGSMARAEILGAMTCAGVVLLNVAVNMAPRQEPIALSLLAPATSLPMPYGPARFAVALAVLYLPALLALFLICAAAPALHG